MNAHTLHLNEQESNFLKQLLCYYEDMAVDALDDDTLHKDDRAWFENELHHTRNLLFKLLEARSNPN